MILMLYGSPDFCHSINSVLSVGLDSIAQLLHCCFFPKDDIKYEILVSWLQSAFSEKKYWNDVYLEKREGQHGFPGSKMLIWSPFVGWGKMVL